MYYGWKIVGVAFITLFVSIGFIFYSYGVFMPTLEVEFGSTRLAGSLGLSLMMLTMGLSGPYLGKAVDHNSIRKIMISGILLMAFGFLLASRTNAMWQLQLILATVLGLGAALSGMIPSQTLVANWFIRRRGLALGVATMGVSLAGILMPLISTKLIEVFGWRITFFVYALIAVAVIVPFTYILLSNRPEEEGLYPDGESQPSSLPPIGLFASVETMRTEDQRVSDALNKQTWTFDLARRNVNFWAITFSMGFNLHCIGAVLMHMIWMGIDGGLSPFDAAILLSVSAGVAIIGKVLFGSMADRIDTRIAVWLAIAFQMLGLSILATSPEHTGLIIAVGLFGFGMGGIFPLWGSLIGEAFGRQNFANVMGMMSPCMLPILISGIPLAGYIFDRTGSYTLTFQIFIGVYVCSAIAMLFVHKEDVDQRMKRNLPTKRNMDTVKEF